MANNEKTIRMKMCGGEIMLYANEDDNCAGAKFIPAGIDDSNAVDLMFMCRSDDNDKDINIFVYSDIKDENYTMSATINTDKIRGNA